MKQSNLVELTVRNDYDFMRQDLIDHIKDLQGLMKSDPKEYIEHGCDEPSIDIRLCIELDGSWIFRTGDSSFDERHSALCGASSVQLDTETKGKKLPLLEKLLDQVMDQLYSMESA